MVSIPEQGFSHSLDTNNSNDNMSMSSLSQDKGNHPENAQMPTTSCDQDTDVKTAEDRYMYMVDKDSDINGIKVLDSDSSPVIVRTNKRKHLSRTLDVNLFDVCKKKTPVTRTCPHSCRS